MDCYHDMLRTLVYHHFLFTTGINELTRFHHCPINRPKIHYQLSLLIHTFSRVFSLAMQYGEGYSDLAAVDDTPLPSPMPLWLSHIMTVASPTSPSPVALAHRVIVAHRLPLRVAQDPTVLFGFTFTYQLRSGSRPAPWSSTSALSRRCVPHPSSPTPRPPISTGPCRSRQGVS
jgi:hypothetical protein